MGVLRADAWYRLVEPRLVVRLQPREKIQLGLMCEKIARSERTKAHVCRCHAGARSGNQRITVMHLQGLG